ncbi:hypothetical protein RRG08_010094 [Elysia crispata]|uniref:Uncharacterized protein n=1 Tax=Elysia crispata TaxID=231223 RepID=A0AAE1A4L5_9GAST|nr:hypothetical protein RRG08_010094 [Elysia crispata]
MVGLQLRTLLIQPVLLQPPPTFPKRRNDCAVIVNTPMNFLSSYEAESGSITYFVNHCGRTKVTAIANALASHCMDKLADSHKESVFSLSTDGSNKNGMKLYPIVIQHYDKSEEVKKVLKHCPTRWLSLSPFLKRFLELWQSLLKYITKLQKETLEEEERKKGKKKAVEDTLIASWFKDKRAT